MKVYELVLLLYNLFVVVWIVRGIRKYKDFWDWLDEGSVFIGVLNCLLLASCIVFNIFYLKEKINWSFLYPLVIELQLFLNIAVW